MYINQEYGVALGITAAEAAAQLGQPPTNGAKIEKWSGTQDVKATSPEGAAILDKYATIFANLAGGVINLRTAKEQRKLVDAQKAAALQSGALVPAGMPTWVPYAAIGGGVLLLLMFMRK
jgi:hypothetical protein